MKKAGGSRLAVMLILFMGFRKRLRSTPFFFSRGKRRGQADDRGKRGQARQKQRRHMNMKAVFMSWKALSRIYL